MHEIEDMGLIAISRRPMGRDNNQSGGERNTEKWRMCAYIYWALRKRSQVGAHPYSQGTEQVSANHGASVVDVARTQAMLAFKVP